MKPVLNKMYTKLMDGKLITFIRHYYNSSRAGYISYRENEDTIVSSASVRNPRKKWDGEPFIDYHKEFVGRLSYKEFCEQVNKDSIWVFNNFTNCSDRMWEEVCRNCG